MNWLRVLAILICVSNSAFAQQFYTKAFIPGLSLVNVGDQGCNDFPFINVLLCSLSQTSSGGFAYPGVLDANGYPNNGTVSNSITYSVPITPNYAGTSWNIDWSGTCGASSGAYGMQISGGGAANPRFTVTAGSSFVSGSTASNINLYGQNGLVTFTMNANAGVPLTFTWVANATFTNCTSVRLYLASNATALNAGSIFNPDFLSDLAALHPKVIRVIDWDGTNAQTQANATTGVEVPTTAFAYMVGWWNPSDWAGTISCPESGNTCTSDTYTASCPSAQPSCGTYTNGEVIQGQINAANATTSPTFSAGGGAALPIETLSAAAPSDGALAASALWTLQYDSVLNVWLGSAGGIYHSVPVQIDVALANTLYASLWYNIPAHVADNATAITNVVLANLSPGLTFYPEYSDEIWNGNYAATAWATARGAALNFSAGSNRQTYGFYGLRVRQIMGNITTLWNGKTKPALQRVMAVQALGTPSQNNTYRLEGTDLCGTSCGNSTYQSLVGVDYNSSPNHPINFSDVLSYAIYVNGGVVNGGYAGTYASGDLAGCGMPGTNSGGLQCAADNYTTGTTASIAAAFAWLDNDVRAGTKNSVLGNQTLLAYSEGGGTYSGWNTIAGDYSFPVIAYEGGFQDIAPTVAQCQASPISGVNSTLGTNASTYCGPSGEIQTMINAYRQSSWLYQLTLDLYNQFIAGSPSNSVPAWYTFCYGSDPQWSMCNGSLYGGWFQSYPATQVFNHPS
jgi:hypothetical protein